MDIMNWFTNKYPRECNHELNLDFILTEYLNTIRDFKTFLKNYPADVSSAIMQNRNALYVEDINDINGRYYYISVNGDDKNDGLTANTPVKTVKRAMLLASSHSSDVRLRFCAPGIYNIDWLVYTSGGLHINASVPDVTLVYSNIGISYMTHINLKGYDVDHPLKIQCIAPQNIWYMDGGALITDSVDFDCTVRLNGATLESYRTKFTSLLVFDSTVTINYMTYFKDPTDTRGNIYLFNSNFMVATPNCYLNLTHDSVYDFLYARGSRITNTQSITNVSGYVCASNNVGQSVYISSNTSHAATLALATNNNFNASNVLSNISLT